MELKAELDPILPACLDFFSDNEIVAKIEKMKAAPVLNKLVHLMNKLCANQLSGTSSSDQDVQSQPGTSSYNSNKNQDQGDVTASASDSDSDVTDDPMKKEINGLAKIVNINPYLTIDQKKRRIKKLKRGCHKLPDYEKNLKISALEFLENNLKECPPDGSSNERTILKNKRESGDDGNNDDSKRRKI